MQSPFNRSITLPDRVTISQVTTGMYGMEMEYHYSASVNNLDFNIVLSVGSDESGYLSLNKFQSEFSSLSEAKTKFQSILDALSYDTVLYAPDGLGTDSFLAWDDTKTVRWHKFDTEPVPAQNLFRLFVSNGLSLPRSDLTTPKKYYGCIEHQNQKEAAYTYGYQNCILWLDSSKEQHILPAPQKEFVFETFVDTLNDGDELIETTKELDKYLVTYTV